MLEEAHPYRYAEAGDGEEPIDDHNHALAALRDLISGIDGNGGVWRRKRAKTQGEREEPKPPTIWEQMKRPGLWTNL